MPKNRIAITTLRELRNGESFFIFGQQYVVSYSDGLYPEFHIRCLILNVFNGKHICTYLHEQTEVKIEF